MKYLLILITFNIALSKTIIISDIDETIKQSSAMNYAQALWKIVYKKAKPYKGLEGIYQYIHEQSNSQFYYVSASYRFLYDPDQWLNENGLGFHKAAIQRKITSNKFDFKTKKLESILSQVYEDGDIVLLFGDNLALDPEVFEKVMKTNFNKNIFSFIRDIRGETLSKKIESRIKYFITELELIGSDVLELSIEEKERIKDLKKDELLPKYIEKFMIKKYIEKKCSKLEVLNVCEKIFKKRMKKKIQKYFNDQLRQ